MTEDEIGGQPDGQRRDPSILRDADDHLNPLWVERLRMLIAAAEADAIAELVEPLHASDMGDVLEALEPAERLALIALLGEKFDYSALTEVDETIRTQVMDNLTNAEIARGVSGLDSDDAVYILEDMEAPDREEILAQMPAFERLSLKRSLDFPEESAGRRMQTEFIAIPPFWTVGQTIDYLRSEKDLPDEFFQIYVVDPSYTVLGTLPLDKFLRSQRNVRVQELMNTNVIQVPADEDQEEAARDFERYDLVEVPVVDDNKRLVGVLTIDDIVDVIQEEATEDIRKLAGVGDEEISDRVTGAVKSRGTWLFINMITATLASIVIGFFDGTIEQMVALAVLMPIVAAMGGNAGTQTMTITVRALAMRELDSFKLRRLVTREIVVGFINGLIFAVLIGLITAVRFGNPSLGVVIALAIVINFIFAGTAGVLIPIAFNKAKIDPAVASSTFVMTITDIVGFFAFLLLAGFWFGLF